MEKKIIVEIDNKKPTYDKIKHLEFVENIIKRMADNSLSMKKFCVATNSSIFIIAFKGEVKKFSTFELLFVAFILTVIFACIDAYYLSLERHFRNFYIDVNSRNEIDYSIGENKKVSENFCCAFWSKSVIGFYSVFFIIIGVTYYFLNSGGIK